VKKNGAPSRVLARRSGERSENGEQVSSSRTRVGGEGS
jgi:hypothetical protein